MSDAKEFPLAVVLTALTGRLLCPIGDLYGVLDYMTGESLMTHQLPRASEECKDPILIQHPGLADVTVPDGLDSYEKVAEWLAPLEARYGSTVALAPLADDDHIFIDPITELRMMRPDM